MPDETSVNPITLQGLPAPGLPAPERNLGQLLYQLPAEVKTLIRKLEKFLYKLNAAETAITFNKVCMKEGLLPKYNNNNNNVTDLAGMRSFENLNRMDVILSSSEAEDVEAAMRSIVEATSWMDWWMFSMKFLAHKSYGGACLIRCLSLAGTRCQILLPKTDSTLWASRLLNGHNAVLVKVKYSISFESFMDLDNDRLSNSTELLPVGVLEKAVEKSSRALQDEAICKAVS